MALPRQWSFPVSISETIANGAVTNIATGTPGFVLNADLVTSPNIQTAPANSASVANGYGANTASVATVVQNTLGYDAQIVGYFYGAASVASFAMGVGATSPVTMTTLNGTALTGTAMWTFPAYVPAGYYWSWQATQANGASVPSSNLTTVWFPV